MAPHTGSSDSSDAARGGPQRSVPAVARASEVRAVHGVDEPWTVRRLLKWIQDHLGARGVDSPRLSAEILVAHVLGCERLRLYMDVDRVPNDHERAALRELVGRAARHEPVQYLVGTWPFHGRMFEVSPATLIPRPSTETVVEEAVRWYRERLLGQPFRCADIGTGTGIIAVSVVAEIQALVRARSGGGGCRPLGGAAAKTSDLDRDGATEAAPSPETQPLVRCIAVDIEPAAVDLARRNVDRHCLAESIEVHCGSLYEPLATAAGVEPGSLDAVLSNPPYISDVEWADVASNVRDYEPVRALRAGREGLDVLRPLVAEAPTWLRPGGVLIAEFAASQRDAVERLLAQSPDLWTNARFVMDAEGHWRTVVVNRR